MLSRTIAVARQDACLYGGRYAAREGGGCPLLRARRLEWELLFARLVRSVVLSLTLSAVLLKYS
jgi:hypothetical protein